MSANWAFPIFLVVLVAGVIAWRGWKVRTVFPPNVGLLYRGGRFVRELPPGEYGTFDLFKKSVVATISKASLPQQLGEITVVSKDQFSFRVGLAPVVEVVDARAYAESQPVIEPSIYGNIFNGVSVHAALHALTASAALEAVATHMLRDLIADPRLLAAEVQGRLADALPGARIASVLVTSMTLPPETRRMFTDIERSKVEGEVALERARGEQAAMRALANAARLVKDNPALANLRFLQTLEHTPGAKTFVVGGNGMPLGTKDA